MSNMNKRTRDKLYPIIVTRDGEYCRCCGKLPHEGQLVLDHRDNNNTNNTHTNLQILCKSCNYLKNSRKEPLDLCVKEDNNSCISINRKKEPQFKEFLFGEIERKDAVKLKNIINLGAAAVDISPVTAKRYLDKLTVEGGELMEIDFQGDTEVIFSQYHNFQKSPQNEWDW